MAEPSVTGFRALGAMRGQKGGVQAGVGCWGGGQASSRGDTAATGAAETANHRSADAAVMSRWPAGQLRHGEAHAVTHRFNSRQILKRR